jgi:hypothetical protein
MLLQDLFKVLVFAGQPFADEIKVVDVKCLVLLQDLFLFEFLYCVF